MKYNLKPEQMPVIAIDFDGVIVEDKWPEIGPSIPGAIETINQWYEDGFWIIINSCRDRDHERVLLKDWLRHHSVKYHTINQNLVWRIEKYGTDPRKIGADIYIDDHNIEKGGIPITTKDWPVYNNFVRLMTLRKEVELCKE